MMINNSILGETINKFVRDTVDLILGIPGYSILAEQKNAPRPVGEYASVKIISNTPIGTDEIKYANRVDGDLDSTRTALREVFISINFYRDDAMDLANFVNMAFTGQSVSELFKKAKLGFISRSAVRNISIARENSWEERAQFDLSVAVTGNVSETVTAICSVDMGVEFQKYGLRYTYNLEVN